MCVILFVSRFLVDNMPIRVFKNNQNLGVPYLNSQAMAVYTSLWDGSQWATEGDRVKIDWQYAPFIATYEGFNVGPAFWECLTSVGLTSCKAQDEHNIEQHQRLIEMMFI